MPANMTARGGKRAGAGRKRAPAPKIPVCFTLSPELVVRLREVIPPYQRSGFVERALIQALLAL